MLDNLFRLFHTVKHLKPRQIYFYILRRIIIIPYLPPKQPGSRNPNFTLHQSSQHHQCIQSGHFVFHNETSEFPTSQVQWRAQRHKKLWRYNLHYFDYLQSTLSIHDTSNLITDWIAKNPYPSEDAWEPYPVSLRLINWIKYFLTLPADSLPKTWLDSLYAQGHYLTRHIEWHIDANHLLKNCIALTIWSHYFTDDLAVKWRLKSIKYLRRICSEQFNADGGHCERSPMYHNIILGHLLEAYSCLSLNSHHNIDWLASIIQAAIRFGRTITLPNGQIPLLKDSALGIAPDIKELELYAIQIGIEINDTLEDSNIIHYLPQTGYALIKNKNDFVLMDVGQITPSYQPGHAHCDALHIELVYNRHSIFTDSGVYCYQPVAERNKSRSVRAHNTVCINGREQHQIWGAFRMGKRGRISAVQVTADTIIAEFTPYYSSPKCHVSHKRAIEFQSDQTLTITDTISGAPSQRIEIYWHLSPDLRPEIQDKNINIYDKDLSLVTVMKLQHSSVIPSITESLFYPEFGLQIIRSCIVLTLLTQASDEKISYKISKS